MCKFFLLLICFWKQQTPNFDMVWNVGAMLRGFTARCPHATWSLVESYDYWTCGGNCGQWQKHHHCLDKCGNHVWSQTVSHLYRSWMCVPVQGYLKWKTNNTYVFQITLDLVKYILMGKTCKSIGVLSTLMVKYKGNTKVAAIHSIISKRQVSCNVNLICIRGEKKWRKSNGISFIQICEEPP